MNEEVIKTGLVGDFNGFFSYCNEKDPNRGGFLFKCNDECVHNKTHEES